MADFPKVYIIILNWNNWRDTVECLESVYQNSYPNFQVICVDNASSDRSEQMIRNWAEGRMIVSGRFFEFDSNKPIPFVRFDRAMAEKEDIAKNKETGSKYMHNPLIFIQTGSNAGFAGGNNIALKYVLQQKECSYIWILNNDTVIAKDALAEMISVMEEDNVIGMAGSKLLYHGRPDVLQSAGGGRIYSWLGNAAPLAQDQKDDGNWDNPVELSYVCGASLLVRREVVEDIGLMDDSYFLYWEDVDWGMRARRKKYRLVYCPGSKVWHKEGGTTGGINRLTDYYWTRNGLFFTWKFHPALAFLVPFSYLFKFALVRCLKGQPRNLKAFVQGFLDFVRGKSGEASLE
ncbi:MAG: glycosyltransferase family 2 protein [Candidatus Sulfobium sp.]